MTEQIASGQNLLLDQNRLLHGSVLAAVQAKVAEVSSIVLPRSTDYFGVRFKDDIDRAFQDAGYDPNTAPLGPPTQKNSITAGVDYAVNVVSMARATGEKPDATARRIASIAGQNSAVSDVKTVGPFVNIALDYSRVAPVVLGEVQTMGEHYGHFRDSDPRLVVIDYSSPNVAKNMTAAHLRSTIIGHSLTKLVGASGDIPFGINYIGDWGAQFGSIIYEYRRELGERGDAFLKELDENPTTTLMRLYRTFNELRGNDPEATAAARAIFHELEQGDPELIHLWDKFRAWSLRDFEPTYARLGVSFDAIQGESFFEDKMTAVVEEGLEKGVLKRNGDGSIVFPAQPLTNPTTGVTNDKIMLTQSGEPRDERIVRPNGGTVYLTRDLAAIRYRVQELGADEILYVIGKEQEAHCLKLFAMADQLGYLALGSAQHISFGHLNVDGRKMKTRAGRVVLLDDILDESTAAAAATLNDRRAQEQTAEASHNGLSEAECEVARIVGIGSVIFNDLRQDRTRDIEFNPDFGASVKEGSAAYIQYTNARLTSLLEKVGLPQAPIEAPNIIFPEEKEIIRQIAEFPQVVAEAAAARMPHKIATYLTDLCKSVNIFYRERPIIRAESDAERNFRLNIAVASRQVINNAANLIHLGLPEKM